MVLIFYLVIKSFFDRVVVMVLLPITWLVVVRIYELAEAAESLVIILHFILFTF